MENMSKEEQIGFHKGALTTLVKEKEALVNMLNVVDQLMQMHTNGLKELGIDLAELQGQVQTSTEAEPKKKKMPIEDIL